MFINDAIGFHGLKTVFLDDLCCYCGKIFLPGFIGIIYICEDVDEVNTLGQFHWDCALKSPKLVRLLCEAVRAHDTAQVFVSTLPCNEFAKAARIELSDKLDALLANQEDDDDDVAEVEAETPLVVEHYAQGETLSKAEQPRAPFESGECDTKTAAPLSVLANAWHALLAFLGLPMTQPTQSGPNNGGSGPSSAPAAGFIVPFTPTAGTPLFCPVLAESPESMGSASSRSSGRPHKFGRASTGHYPVYVSSRPWPSSPVSDMVGRKRRYPA